MERGDAGAAAIVAGTGGRAGKAAGLPGAKADPGTVPVGRLGDWAPVGAGRWAGIARARALPAFSCDLDGQGAKRQSRPRPNRGWITMASSAALRSALVVQVARAPAAHIAVWLEGSGGERSSGGAQDGRHVSTMREPDAAPHCCALAPSAFTLLCLLRTAATAAQQGAHGNRKRRRRKAYYCKLVAVR